MTIFKLEKINRILEAYNNRKLHESLHKTAEGAKRTAENLVLKGTISS